MAVAVIEAGSVVQSVPLTLYSTFTALPLASAAVATPAAWAAPS